MSHTLHLQVWWSKNWVLAIICKNENISGYFNSIFSRNIGLVVKVRLESDCWIFDIITVLLHSLLRISEISVGKLLINKQEIILVVDVFTQYCFSYLFMSLIKAC